MVSKIVDIKNDQLSQDVEEAALAILDFWSVTCAPCKAMHPVIEQIANKYEGEIRVVRINIDENPDLTRRFRIKGLPSLIVLKRGEQVEKILGVHTLDKLKNLIQKYK